MDFSPSNKRDFPGRRWLCIVLRSAHLVGVVLAGAAIFGNGPYHGLAWMLMLGTGLSLYAVDLWSNPQQAWTLAGLFIPLKLLLVLAMALIPSAAAALFWLLLLSSSMIAHAPAAFRHRRPLA